MTALFGADYIDYIQSSYTICCLFCSPTFGASFCLQFIFTIVNNKKTLVVKNLGWGWGAGPPGSCDPVNTNKMRLNTYKM